MGEGRGVPATRVGPRRPLSAVTLTMALVALALPLALPNAQLPSGASQRDRALPSIGMVQQVVMVTPSIGYGLYMTWSGSCGAWISAITNGGATFHRPVLVQRVSCASLEVGSEAVAVDANGDVFVYGGRGLFVSRDDARTWAKVAVSGSVLQLVADAGVTWIVEAACAPTTRHVCPLRVARSFDGGRSWNFTTRQPIGAVAQPQLVDRTYLLVAGNGTVDVLSQTPSMGGNGGRQTMWVSTDNGATWRARGVPCRDFYGTLAELAPSGAIWSVCAGEPSAGSQEKWVDVSYNGGRTWRPTGACQGVGQHHDGALCFGYAQNVVVLSGDKAFLADDRGTVLVTNDGGWRWTNVDNNMNSGAGDLCEVQFLNPRDGFAVTTPVPNIWRTTDGGRAWRMLTPHWG